MLPWLAACLLLLSGCQQLKEAIREELGVTPDQGTLSSNQNPDSTRSSAGQSNATGSTTRDAANSSSALPDLVIQSFGLAAWGECAPGNPVFKFVITVRNAGSGPSGEAVVQAMDGDGTNWGNGARLPSIPPGGSQTVAVPIYYLAAHPSHMTTAAPHPFKAVVDPRGLVAEANEANNESSVIKVGAPQGCPPTKG